MRRASSRVTARWNDGKGVLGLSASNRGRSVQHERAQDFPQHPHHSTFAGSECTSSSSAGAYSAYEPLDWKRSFAWIYFP
jgi:hypothetical protein